MTTRVDDTALSPGLQGALGEVAAVQPSLEDVLCGNRKHAGQLARLRDVDLELRRIVEAIPAEWHDANTAPLALVQELVTDRRLLMQLLMTLATAGGCLVSSADCSELEIAAARARGDFYADANGFGWVRRLPEWLGRHSRYARMAGPECCEGRD